MMDWFDAEKVVARWAEGIVSERHGTRIDEGLYGEPDETAWCVITSTVDAPSFADCETAEDQDWLAEEYLAVLFRKYGFDFTPYFGGAGRPFRSSPSIRPVGKRLLVRSWYSWDV
jgi:hypothetical protein